jgi:hypothetical protein
MHLYLCLQLIGLIGILPLGHRRLFNVMPESGLRSLFMLLTFFTVKLRPSANKTLSVLFLFDVLHLNGGISSLPYGTGVMDKARKWMSASMMTSRAALLPAVTPWSRTGLSLFPNPAFIHMSIKVPGSSEWSPASFAMSTFQFASETHPTWFTRC